MNFIGNYHSPSYLMKNKGGINTSKTFDNANNGSGQLQSRN